MAIPPDADILRRLGLIRTLHRIAVQQSMGQDSSAALSILSMHDAAEALLLLIAEKLHANLPKATAFAGYWQPIDDRLSPEELGHKVAMGRLNSARVSIKHHGILPSKDDVGSFRVLTGSFLREATEKVFGLDLDAVSVLSLVSPSDVRADLLMVQEFRKHGKHSEALGRLAIVFDMLIRRAELRHVDERGRSRLAPQANFAFESGFFLRLNDRKFSKAWDKVLGELKSLQTVVRMLALGLDPARYFIFRSLSPGVFLNLNHNYVIVSDRRHEPTDADVEFCLDFVIDVALHLDVPPISDAADEQGGLVP